MREIELGAGTLDQVTKLVGSEVHVCNTMPFHKGQPVHFFPKDGGPEKG
jgi:hypothetical protein